MSFFDPRDRDVLALDDLQFKDLLRRLIEAEAQFRGIPASSITAGGDQNAADGGADATVSWTGQPEPIGWFPRRVVAFQSKAEKMPPSKVTPEMRPQGVARALFHNLAEDEGAYVIFAKERCAHGPLQQRLSAMRAALHDVPNSANVTLHFYDADRIVRWVKAHPGVTAWLLEIVGRPIGGWKPHRNWSGSPTPYLFDDRPRAVFRDGGTRQILGAIHQVREWLATPGGIVRVVGLSGMGKTRFAEALFDPSVGENALPGALAVYGDLSSDLGVRPGIVADRLCLDGQRAVMVVDNCPGEAHRALAQVIGQNAGNASLLTIDFDIGEDDPENTHVIRLSENSDGTVDRLLQSRYPNLQFPERDRLVRFASGNARVALAIASNADRGSLALLSDRQLVERLFHTDRRQHDPALQRCAEVASLVYAFHADGEHAAELQLLAGLAEQADLEFYRAVRDLLERGVAQQRGPQRAILPQALAIHLAKQAFDSFPQGYLVDRFNAGPPRLFVSFTRRLGMLHESNAARSAAELLIGPGGRLDLSRCLSEEDTQAFVYAAPAAPSSALVALERALDGAARDNLVAMENAGRGLLISLTGRLAYSAATFHRAARILVAFALPEPADEERRPAAKMLDRMFRIVASGTQAPPATRMAFLQELERSNDQRDQALAWRLWSEMLKTDGFGAGAGDIDFGTHARGGEWRPTSGANLNEWFAPVVARVTDKAVGQDASAHAAREQLVSNFRGLVQAGQVEAVTQAVRQVAATGHYWAEAWKATCKAIYFGDVRAGQPRHLLAELEAELRPVSLVQQFEAFVLGRHSRNIYRPFPRSDRRGSRNTAPLARAAGKAAARAQDLSRDLLRRSVVNKAALNAFAFGKGFALACTDLVEYWQAIQEYFATADPAARSARVLGGFVAGARKRDPALVDGWLEVAITDPVLAPQFLELAVDGPIDGPSIQRITRSIANGQIRLWQYAILSVGSVINDTPPADLAHFLTTLAGRGSEGLKATIEVLHMRIFADMSERRPVAAELVTVGRDLLGNAALYAGEPGRLDGELALVARAVLVGDGAHASAVAACRALIDACRTHHHASYSFEQLATQIRASAPIAVADEVLESEGTADLVAKQFFGIALGEDEVEAAELAEADNQIISWVREAPQTRAPRLAGHVPMAQSDGQGSVTWAPIAAALIGMPGVEVPVLERFEDRFGVGSWSGSRANRYIRRRRLLVELQEHSNSRVRDWAALASERLERAIEADLEADRREIEERFE